MSISTKLQVQKFEARTLPIKTVTVFADRAELKRTLKVTLQEGLNNIEIDNVASSIESDSIRVDGHGNATIHEVQFKTEQVTQPEVDSPQVTELLKDLEDLKSKCAENEDMKQVYTKRLESLDSVINNLENVILTNVTNLEPSTYKETITSSFNSIFGVHEKRSIDAHSKLRELDKVSNDLCEKIRTIEQKINNMRGLESSRRIISILLVPKVTGAEIELEITYQVNKAHWIPSYDVRVQTKGKIQLQLTYFGNVKQNSGEDWKDAELFLSSGSPRLGSKLPELRTLKAQFPLPGTRKIHRKTQRSLKARAYSRKEKCGNKSIENLNVGCLSRKKASDEDVPRIPMEIAKVEAKKHTLGTTFSIPQKKTIPNDNSEHKVTIAVFNLDPMLHFDCIPSKNTNVFMIATAVNTSTYHLFQGMASIYVDNSFSSKVELLAVAAGEKFDCPLGVDPCLKIQYKPAHKYQQQVGMFCKSAITFHEQKISVKNTKSDPVQLTLFEHIPKSTDEKIKVKVYSPEIQNLMLANSGENTEKPAIENVREIGVPKLPATLNKSNNLEWKILLSGQEEKELCIKWSVEYPANEIVEYSEV